MRPIRLLGLSGSLRAASTNTALLRCAAAAASPSVTLMVFDGLGTLPIFNPDLEGEREPRSVTALRGRVEDADGLVIACPEYAHGIPGGLKNALDWLVSGSEIPGKPVALFHAQTRSQHAVAALREVLATMSATVVFELSLPLLGRSSAAITATLQDGDQRKRLRVALDDVAATIRRSWIAT